MLPHGPVRIASPSGLSMQVNANSSVRRVDCQDVMLNAFLGNELEGGPANLVLRRRAERITWTPLLGPRSPGSVHLDETGLDVRGVWEGLRFCVSLRLAESAPAWFWHVQIENTSRAAQTFDLLHVQDVVLADYGMVRLNEYYASQYVDYTPLTHGARGAVLAIRQNLSIGGRHPWALVGSLGRAAHFATDALSYYGIAARATGVPSAPEIEDLPSLRCQHEHSLAALQDEAVTLAPGAQAARGFFGWLELDHAAASSESDLAIVDRALALPEAKPPPQPSASLDASAPAATLFSAQRRLEARSLDRGEIDALFGSERRAVESDGDQLLSFFRGADAHVVLPEKERTVLRSHGQILRSGEALVPEEESLTSTVFMGGVFHSMVTQGHVSINRLLSTTHGYLGLFRSHGQRVFVELEDGYRLLDIPSAFEMTPSSARWIYRHVGGTIEVRSWAATARHELWLAIDVLEGPPRRFLVSNHLAVNGEDGSEAIPARVARDAQGVAVSFLPDTDLGRRFPDGRFRFDPAPGTTFEQVGGDELLFEDGRSRAQPFLVLVSRETRSFALRMTGQLLGDSASTLTPANDSATGAEYRSRMTGALDLRDAEGAAQDAIAPIAEVLPWFAHDALIHYLAPRGLDQYSGGGWGTRDVCQGPVELLLALGDTLPVRDLLLRVFRQQNPDGDWPQWFMFFERERGIRPGDSHGDIVFWPLLALGQYLLASDDASLLDESLPFFHPEGDARAEHASVLGHVERALALIARRVIPGTRLAVYGHGDWNDSFQPADPALAERLCSAWTVTLHHQMLATLADALRRAGRAGLADELAAQLPLIRGDFQRLLIADGVVTGLAYFGSDGAIEHWLHPRDRERGVGYSLLPMVHAILTDLFTPEQARHHVEVIRRHLLAADGARLFDRPLPYRGGIQRHFQRAETGTFFGREIGLMYTHAHLRYAEAMAHLGDAEAFFEALRKACPAHLQAVVPNARRRQVNCYTSSSDAAFPDRYQAATRYDEVRTGDVAVEGGWRVYSSGAGIAVRLVREHLLGVRLRNAELGIDPVLPRPLDGLRAKLAIAGRPVEVHYRVGARGFGPRALALNGSDLAFERSANPYREGGARVAMTALRERLRADANTLLVDLG